MAKFPKHTKILMSIFGNIVEISEFTGKYRIRNNKKEWQIINYQNKNKKEFISEDSLYTDFKIEETNV